jgi:pilus assembly protein CpaE
MSSILKAVIVDADAESRAAVRRMLSQLQSVVVVAEHADVSEALRRAPAQRPDVVIVEIRDAEGTGRPAASIEGLVRALPEAAIIATGPVTSADLVIQVIRAGALEYLGRPVEQRALFGAVDKVGRVRGGGSPERRAAQVISVFSTKGGLGATTLAINLAVCLAEQGRQRTLLVELDTRPSDVATFLDLRPTYSILDAVENLDRMDAEFLQGLLLKHDSGLWVLAAPVRLERFRVDVDRVPALLEILRLHFDQIVVDLRHDFDPMTIAGLEGSDTILFLTSPNVSALRSAAAGIGAFRHLGLDIRNVKLIVMREETGEDVTLKHVNEAIQLPVIWKTPSDYVAVVSAINHGRPVVAAAPRSKFSLSVRQLAKTLSPGESILTDAPARRSASLLNFAWKPVKD